MTVSLSSLFAPRAHTRTCGPRPPSPRIKDFPLPNAFFFQKSKGAELFSDPGRADTKGIPPWAQGRSPPPGKRQSSSLKVSFPLPPFPSAATSPPPPSPARPHRFCGQQETPRRFGLYGGCFPLLSSIFFSRAEKPFPQVANGEDWRLTFRSGKAQLTNAPVPKGFCLPGVPLFERLPGTFF